MMMMMMMMTMIYYYMTFEIIMPPPLGECSSVAECMVRTLDLRSIGREFESWPLRYRVQPWASC